MNAKKKILMVHNYYQIGGGEHTVFENEVCLLQKNGHDVIQYTRNNNELKDSFVKRIFVPFSAIWSFKTYHEVKNIIQKEKIDIVHCHNTFPLVSPSVYYAARRCKIPVVQTIHNFRFLCPNGLFFCKGKICNKCKEKNSFLDALKNKCYRHSFLETLAIVMMLKVHRLLGTYQKISYIFLSEFNRNQFGSLIDINGKNIFIKSNFVTSNINYQRKAKNNQFVYAGRLEEAKGISHLIEYWKDLPKDYVLHIYGDGPLKNTVISSCCDNIQYFGFQSHEIIDEDIKKAKAVVFSSECYEGFPMVIAESFSLLCPVLVYDIGNGKALIKKSKAGVLYRDKKSFIDGINEIIQNNEFYSKNAYQYYQEELSEEKNYQQLIKIYDQARVIY